MHLGTVEGDLDLAPSKAERYGEAGEVWHRPRLQLEHPVPDPLAEIEALDQIESAGHDSEVDALGGGAALHVAYVALQRDHVPLPRRLQIQIGEDAGVSHEAQSRTVRSALIVVLQVLAGHVRGVGIAQPLEDLPELVFAEKEEEEHRVRLLGELVTVWLVTGRLQDPVQPLDVAVLSAISLPVQFLQVFVTLELADDPVAMEGHEHPAAYLLPLPDPRDARPQPVPQEGAAAFGEHLEQRGRGLHQPGHHDVRIGVVAQSRFIGARILLVELVGTHHAVDLVAITLRVEMRDARPEASYLEHHLGAVLEQKVLVGSGLKVMPDVVEDGRVHVALDAAQVRLPDPRARVHMDDLRLLGAITSALPGIHGATVAGLHGRRPRLTQAAIAVHEQLARDPGQPEVEKRIDVELVPEDVAAIRLTVQSAGWDAGIQPHCVLGRRLEDVRDVEAKEELDSLVLRHVDVAIVPELAPGGRVPLELLCEARIASDRPLGGAARLADTPITRCVEGDHLLHPDGDFFLQPESQRLMDVVLHVVERPLNLRPFAVSKDAS